jgi:hypothetical protein
VEVEARTEPAVGLALERDDSPARGRCRYGSDGVSQRGLGERRAPGMAALKIGVGALSIPLAYLLARALLDERRARIAALLYVFAPSAVLYRAT